MKINRTIAFLVICFGVAACDNSSDASKRSTGREDAKYREAMTYYQAGNLEKAIEGLERCININPLNTAARFQLACLKEEAKKDYLGAILEYREFLRMSPDGEKAKIAAVRLERCNKLLEERFEAVEAQKELEASTNEAIAKLTEKNDKLSKELATSRKDLEDLRAEYERLKKMVSSIGASDEENTKAPKIALTDEALLEDALSSPPSVVSSEEVKKLKESLEEDEKAPLPQVEKKKVNEPAKTEVKTPQIEKPEVYVVKEGETLISIARRFYGKASYWRQIQQANRAVISIDGKLKAGMEIKLP